MSTYQFKYHDAWQIEAASPEQLKRLEWIDRLLDDQSVEHDPAHLDSLSDEDLRVLVGMLPGQRKPAPPAAPRADPGPLIPIRGDVVKRPKRVKLDPSIPRYRAALWVNGQSVHLGYYYTEEVRDEEVAAAKLRRDMGLPIRLDK
jgi:hypothetical protein